MKWYAIGAIALLLLVSYAYYTVNKEDALRNVVTDIKLYMAKLETLKREVRSLEELRDLGAALDKTAEKLKAKEGELKGKYGDMKSLEAQCEAFSNNCAAINANIDDLNKRLDSLRDDMAKCINHTNALDKAISRLRDDRDSVSDEIQRLQDERDRFKRQRDAEEKRYGEQKRIADSEALRADSEALRAKEEKKRADDAKLAADVAERDAEIAIAAQKKRSSDARADADKEVAAQVKRKVGAEKEAGATVAKAEGEVAKLKSLASEVAALEARRNELSGINEQLSDAKVALKEEQDKLGKARARVAAQDIARQVDLIREGVSRSLKEFSSKLEEFSKKQNNEVKQGGLE